MEITNLQLVERTTHRPEDGGFEHWSFIYNDQKYLLHCDIRIPGIVSPFYQELPECTDKVIVVDFFTVNETITEDFYLDKIFESKNYTQETNVILKNSIIQILLNTIKPNRNFEYLAFFVEKTNETFYKDIIESITVEPALEVYNKTYAILTPENQTYVDSGAYILLLGKIKPV